MTLLGLTKAQYTGNRMEIEESEYISECSKKIIEEMEERGIDLDIQKIIASETLLRVFHKKKYNLTEISSYLFRLVCMCNQYYNLFENE